MSTNAIYNGNLTKYYVAAIAGTGYSIGDTLAQTIVLNGLGATVENWYNQTTKTTITTLPNSTQILANLIPIDEREARTVVATSTALTVVNQVAYQGATQGLAYVSFIATPSAINIFQVQVSQDNTNWVTSGLIHYNTPSLITGIFNRQTSTLNQIAVACKFVWDVSKYNYFRIILVNAGSLSLNSSLINLFKSSDFANSFVYKSFGGGSASSDLLQPVGMVRRDGAVAAQSSANAWVSPSTSPQGFQIVVNALEHRKMFAIAQHFDAGSTGSQAATTLTPATTTFTSTGLFFSIRGGTSRTIIQKLKFGGDANAPNTRYVLKLFKVNLTALGTQAPSQAATGISILSGSTNPTAILNTVNQNWTVAPTVGTNSTAIAVKTLTTSATANNAAHNSADFSIDWQFPIVLENANQGIIGVAEVTTVNDPYFSLVWTED